MARISIVIPTRQRAETLRHCLETCVIQDFEDVEFIVSSNACMDDTKDVTLSFNDRRIRLIETPERLSMSENWEFALGHTQGQYVGYLGDDDGILPKGLSLAWSAVCKYEYPAALVGPAPGPFFVWPDAVGSMARAGWNPGTLFGHLGSKTRIRKSQEMLKLYANSEVHYSNLPSLYYGLVRQTIIERAKRNGRFFHSRTPDVYSAVAIAAVSDNYLQLREPVMMAGLSKHSGGVLHVFGQDSERRGSKVAELYSKENNLPFHAALTECPSLPILMGESFLQVRDLGLIQPPINWNYQRMIDAAIAELPTRSETVQLDIIRALREIAARHNLDANAIPSSPTASSLVPRDWFSLTSDATSFRVDTRPFQIESISEAARFYGLLQRLIESFVEVHASTEQNLRDAEARSEAYRIRAQVAEMQVDEVESLRAVAEAAQAATSAELASVSAKLAAASAELAALRSSKSWHITAPLRVIDALARGRLKAALTESGLSDEWVKRLQNPWTWLRRR